ncbi:MAG: M3 family metallopeptidase [Erythrobacter sp.]|uniref:M3 family metallopeptidase n=1 Tax=Erythrobacter sp. TaxID=1042 RepID=UPI00261B6B68|nr:M3 family metallopeptidase [Erythrobacter sp.]MDJ0978924.1 M3 family metallopeptidase [Erythrobacter sp.]
MTIKTRTSRSLAPALFTVSAFALVAGWTAHARAEQIPSNATTHVDKTSTQNGSGYFAAESALPFKAPDFSKITEDDFMPAFEQGMAVQKAEIQAIVDNPDAATFENTIVAYESSGRMLSRVSRVFGQLTSANTTERLDEINREISPKRSAHYSSITLNPGLFARVKAVYEQRETLSLDPESAKLLEKTYEDMVKAGAELSAEERERVKTINTELSTLTTEFSQMVRNATNAQPLLVDTAEELAGLSQTQIDAAAALATEMGMEGKYAIALQNTTQQPLLPELENRAVRETFFKLSYQRADGTDPEYDTRMLVAKIAALRAEKASLFGKPNWASYIMQGNMADTPELALEFMEQMVPALAQTQRREAAVLNEAIAESGEDFTVQPWDWYRYANKVREERYNFSEAEVTEYLELERVLEDGVFYMANQMYGLTFERRDDIPTYHPDVWVYTIFDADGSELALFYFDPFQRPSKRGGAWMSSFVPQNYLNDEKPVILNTLNVPKAAEGETQFISWDWVQTAFHEFGHGLHGMFAEQKYPSLSGTATPRDFVEYPAQVHEMWQKQPAVLQNYAKHYETGETMPLELLDRIEAAFQFNQGYDFGEVMEAALLDMKWHSLSAEEAAAIDTPEKVTAFETQALSELGLEVENVPPRYRSTYFNHIFSSPTGYSSGYYSYLWTQMLDHDSRNYILENGGLTRANGKRLREKVLSRGGTMDYDVVYRSYAERDPDVKYMLASLGLLKSEEGEASASAE